jgi:hypothetical protein
LFASTIVALSLKGVRLRAVVKMLRQRHARTHRMQVFLAVSHSTHVFHTVARVSHRRTCSQCQSTGVGVGVGVQCVRLGVRSVCVHGMEQQTPATQGYTIHLRSKRQINNKCAQIHKPAKIPPTTKVLVPPLPLLLPQTPPKDHKHYYNTNTNTNNANHHHQQ